MRRTNWQRLLNEYIVSEQERYLRDGFHPGIFDCCTFAAEWVRRCTGVDHFAEYRGQYATAARGRSLLPEGGLRRVLTDKLGEPVHPAHAHRGDIALRESDMSLGIFFTSGSRMMALFLGDGGFILHKAKDTDYAFRV